MNRTRPVAEQLKEIIKQHGRIDLQELSGLTGKRTGNITAVLSPDVAVGRLRMERQLEDRGGRHRVLVIYYEPGTGQVAPAAEEPSAADPPEPTFAARPPKSPQAAGMRKCLGTDCGRMFRSTHAGNRLCPTCATRANRTADAGLFDIPAEVRYH